MRRVFFDANVIIAGSMSRRGASRALLTLAEAGMFRLVVSRQVIDEVERNLRDKLPEVLPIAAEMLNHAAVDIVQNPLPETFVRWIGHIEEKDAPILEAALQAEVDYLVTLNSRDFTPQVASLTGLRIVSPAELTEAIRSAITSGLA